MGTGVTTSRRRMLQGCGAAIAAVSVGHSWDSQKGTSLLAQEISPSNKPKLIIDTHQHLWDLENLDPPWLKGSKDILNQKYSVEEYRKAVEGYNVRAVYMEVDVARHDHDKEASYVLGLCKSGKENMVGAVIGGRPADPNFEEYIKRHNESGFLRGVRQVLHGGETAAGYCLSDEFVNGVRVLGKYDLSFDLCMRPTELDDGAKLVDKCPETRFVLDHCGNADPKAFLKSNETKPSHDPVEWKRAMERISRKPNVICKISGIVASAPVGWDAGTLAPIVDYCLDKFGPERVVFGGDWPVCLKGAQLSAWIEALSQIMETRPLSEQDRLWANNAKIFYRLAL